ncbi:MAG: glycoside hydrolase family 97 N-terminal domain-containing protein, partial [Thermomonas sp.]
MLRLMLALLAALPVVAHAGQVAQVASPDGHNVVQLDLNGEGRVAYRVLRDGKPVIDDSRLGIQLRNGRELLRNLKLDAQASSSFDETWEQPWGERRFIRNHYNELRATFAETDRDHRRFDVVFRVYDDGLGFRYEVPEQSALAHAEIEDEFTEFAIARPASAWWIPAGEWNRYEYLYNHTSLNEVSQAHTPITMRTADGLHLSIHEAALVNYAGMWLRRSEGQRL